MNAKNTLLIKTDGGARGNPGPAAIGVFIAHNDSAREIHHFSRYIGKTTNNTAEYQAVLEALQWVEKNLSVLTRQYSKIQLVSDSKLLVCQLNGIYKIKKIHLQKMYQRIKTLELKIGLPVYYQHVKRELNTEPDKLVNNVLIINNTG